MDTRDFEQKVQEFRAQVREMYRKNTSAHPTDDTEFSAALESLNTALEELSVTEEELRQQNEELIEARRGLEEEKVRYYELFEAAPDGYLVTDRSGNIIEANQAATIMLGIDGKLLVESPLRSFVSSGDRRRFLAMLDELHRAGKGGDWKFQLKPRRGAARTVTINVRQNSSRRGVSNEYLWLLRDVTEVEKTESQISELKHRLFESIEAERLSIAREIHDGPIQDLYSISFILKSIEQTADNDALQNDLSYANNTIRKVADSLRSVCGELRPPVLAPFGLAKAIRSHAGTAKEQHPDVEIKLDLALDEQVLSERVRLALYRIYQQLIANALRHAQAMQVSVTFGFDNQRAVLQVMDNGIGFLVPKSWIDFVREGHYGLAGIAERVETLGGEMTIASQPKQGTTVRVSIPLPGKPTDISVA